MGLLRGWQRSVAVLPLLLIGVVADSGCYDTGDGSAPPLESFYFPVGLKVSHGGTVLYAVNSNFDLQYNGGTLQAYDLRLIRQHALLAIADPTNPNLPLIRPDSPEGCPDSPPIFKEGEPGRQPLGETCAPPVDSRAYFRDSAVIGAFATDLLLSQPPQALRGDFIVPDDRCAAPPCIQSTKVHADDPLVPPGNSRFDRLFTPVRGNATLTWASVERDSFESTPSAQDTKESYAPFRIQCGQGASRRCDATHQIGEDPNEEGNTRHITMPGEPFGVTISDDGASLVLTHQNDTKTTLFSTGLSRTRNDDERDRPLPAIQFITDQVPIGGVGIAGVPHDPDAFLGALSLPRPAFLETSRAVPEVSLLRRYSDEEGGVGPSVPRPFLDVETAFPITVSAGGNDSRGIVIDPTPRLSCKARVAAVGPGQTVEERDRQILACARKPARAFIANRSPPALLVGDVGVIEGGDGAYDPDRLTLHSSVPLSAGASKVYLAPIVDVDGAYALRVFVVCFDSATIYVYDPDADAVEAVIRVAPGPFAMAFDPFSLEDVATHVQVPFDERDRGLGLRRYRFAYLASFTQSFVQLIDLDKTAPPTFERVVYTLGRPTNPKGS
ncbi:MAG: hypothetical protein KF764_30485 [Labilithrix sp.]|nr:hypothetical protein [Labilithrix sp.]MBX3222752.1 hypothetical protein [Labilithrix sp.]